MSKQQLSFYGACVFAAFGVFFFVIGGWSIGLVVPQFIENANVSQVKGLLCFIVAAILYSNT